MKLLIFLFLVSVSVVGAMADPGKTDEKGDTIIVRQVYITIILT